MEKFVKLFSWALSLLLGLLFLGCLIEGIFIGAFLFLLGFVICCPSTKTRLRVYLKQKEQKTGNKQISINDAGAISVSLVLFFFGATFLPEVEKQEVVYKEIKYQVLKQKDFSFAGRDRVGVYIYAPDAETDIERASVVKQAAFDLQEKTGADFVDVILEVSNKSFEKGEVLAIADYAPDGCGTSGDNCGNEELEIRTAVNNMPGSLRDFDIAKLEDSFIKVTRF